MSREVWVDEKGYAHDDEGNSWNTGMPSGHYDVRSVPRPQAPRPRKYPVQKSKENDARLSKIVLAAAASGDYKGAAFMNEVRSKSEMSEKQFAYATSLFNRYKSFAPKFPDLDFSPFDNAYRFELRSNPSPSDLQKVEKFFLVRQNDKGKYELFSYKLHPNLKPVSTADWKAQIAAVDRVLAKSDNHFLKTIRYKLEDEVALSPKQLEIVRKIFAENGEPDPVEFRTASNLRSQTIRLAYEKPELREHLLPLLKKAEGNGLPEYVSEYGTDTELYRLISTYAETMMVGFPGLAMPTPQDAYLELKIQAGDKVNDYNSFLDWIEKNVRFPVRSRI